MKQKLKIKDINVAIDKYGHEYFDHFECKSESGGSINIDALISGCFDDEINDMTSDEQIEWAKSKIGKHLFVTKMSPYVYLAIGKTYIV